MGFLKQMGMVVLALAVAVGLFYHYAPRCVAGNCKDGHGVRMQRNVFRYTGEFRHGKPHGKGRFENLALDYTYQGAWLAGQMHGTGVYRDERARTEYRGAFQGGRKHGSGELRQLDRGTILFRGHWKYGKRASAATTQ